MEKGRLQQVSGWYARPYPYRQQSHQVQSKLHRAHSNSMPVSLYKRYVKHTRSVMQQAMEDLVPTRCNSNFLQLLSSLLLFVYTNKDKYAKTHKDGCGTNATQNL